MANWRKGDIEMKDRNESQESEDILVLEKNNEVLRRRFPEKTAAMKRAGVLSMWMWPSCIVAFFICFAHPLIGSTMLVIFSTILVRNGKKAKRLREEMVSEIGLDETGKLVETKQNSTNSSVVLPPAAGDGTQKRIRKY